MLRYKIYPSLLDAYAWYASSESEGAEQDLLNKINRVPFQSDAASKGTWFNRLIDEALIGRDKYGECYMSGPAKEICDRLEGSVKQLFVKTTLNVDGAEVELYGYLDYLKQYRVTDLKTTKAYELGKYKNSLQLHFYPVALIDAGNDIQEFEFLVTDFDNVYTEVYPVNYEGSKAAIIEACRKLISFIESKRNLITDKKIFALD